MARRLLFLVDFDETLTRAGKDTISRLASAAYTCRLSGPELPPWSYFVDTYMYDYNNHVQAHPPTTRNTLEAETEFLKSLKPIERASVDRIEKSGLFKNLDLSTLLHTAAGDKQRVGELMREGWWEAMKKVVSHRDQGKFSVVSVNWSRSWIRKCLEDSAQDGMTGVRGIDIFANELVTNSQGITTGALDRWFGQDDGGIWTGWDKLRVMKDIITDNQKDPDEEKRKVDLVVYVGDSTTDLLCLLEADIGIFFGQKLDGVCERLGVEIKEGLTAGYPRNTPGGGRSLTRIKEWKEVDRWLDTL